MVVFDDDKQQKRVDELLHKEEEELAEVLSQKYGLEYLDLSRHSINADALRYVPEEEARKAKIAVFDAVGKNINIAILSPNNHEAMVVIDSLKQKGYQPTLFMVSNKSLERAWERYKETQFTSEVQAGVLDIANDEINAFIDKIKVMADVETYLRETMALKKAYRTSRILEVTLGGALSLGASDVHLEPEEAEVRLRFRLDGVLTDILKFEKETYSLVLSRIKLLSGLKLNVKDSAQDGRFSIKIKGAEIEIRTSILPGAYGESIVLRILNPETIGYGMEVLGIPDRLYALLDREIRKPNGMLLNTGPTGSGKTTTLYAFLKKVHTPDVKIITIEDPIEYHLQGIVQTQVEDQKYTFAEGLRSALRQDPDIIMVGEIRDGETANIAINAGLTGHLVFSTLHTNNAAGAFPRLIDLGVNPKIISSAINVVIAQRLVRKLCDKCKKQIPLEGQTKLLAEKILEGSEDAKEVNKGVMWQAVGCDACNSIGYKGRIGIFEAIKTDAAIEAVLQGNPSEREIWKAAKQQGIWRMEEDGIRKVLAGVTTIEELSRVIDLRAF